MGFWVTQVVLDQGFSIGGLEASTLRIDHPLVPSLVVCVGIESPSISEFEHFFLNIGRLIVLCG